MESTAGHINPARQHSAGAVAWPMADGVEVAASLASSLAAFGESSLAPYWRFQRSVAKAQLAAWLPAPGRLLIDISGPASYGAGLAAARGHIVVRVLPAHPGPQSSPAVPGGSGQVPAAGRRGQPASGARGRYGSTAHAHFPGVSGYDDPATRPGPTDYLRGGQDPTEPVAGPPGVAVTGQPDPMAPSSLLSGLGLATLRANHAGPDPGGAGAWQPGARPGRIVPVVAEPGSLAFLADGCADGVIAEDGALSRHLMSEDLAAEITRVLRPGGELIACVDSLVLGMAILAEQHHWAHLTDLPHSEVVLIPWPDGTITRCFGSGQLQDLLTEAGLEVNWITPRTVLSPSMVDHVLRQEPGAMGRLVRAELRAERDRRPAVTGSDESFGINLLAAARKPPAADGGPVRHRRITGITKRGRRRTAIRSAGDARG